jgi:hypothetical protein
MKTPSISLKLIKRFSFFHKEQRARRALRENKAMGVGSWSAEFGNKYYMRVLLEYVLCVSLICPSQENKE